MELFHKEIIFDSLRRNNNSKLKLWLQKHVKQKQKYKMKWKNPSSYRETGERSSQKSVKYIVNLNSNEETRPTDKKRILCVLNN